MHAPPSPRSGFTGVELKLNGGLAISVPFGADRSFTDALSGLAACTWKGPVAQRCLRRCDAEGEEWKRCIASAHTWSSCTSRAVMTLRPRGDRLKSRPTAAKALALSRAWVSTVGRCQVRGAAGVVAVTAGAGVSSSNGACFCCSARCVSGDDLLHKEGLEQLPMQALRRCDMQRPTYLAGRVMERLMPLDEAVTVACFSAPCACRAWRMLLFSLFRGCVMYMASVLLLCRPISSASMQQRLMPGLRTTPACHAKEPKGRNL